MKLLGIFILLSLASCTTSNNDFVVFKYTWRYCWEACGKKDNLAAVSSVECICSQGDPIPINPLVRNQKQDSFMAAFLKFLNGE